MSSCGKTTICQMFAALAGHKFYSVNCHLHLETSDFLGGLRPVRHARQVPSSQSAQPRDTHMDPGELE